MTRNIWSHHVFAHRSMSRGVWGGGPLSDCGWCIHQEPFKCCDWHETSRPPARPVSKREITSGSGGRYQCKTNTNFWVMSSSGLNITARMLFIWWTQRLRRFTASLRVCGTGWNNVPGYFVCDIIQHHARRIILGAAAWHVSDAFSFSKVFLVWTLVLILLNTQLDEKSFTFTCFDMREKQRVAALQNRKSETVLFSVNDLTVAFVRISITVQSVQCPLGVALSGPQWGWMCLIALL